MATSIGFNLVQLQYFIAAAEQGNISAAAETLHVSQSAMSAAILRLERQLGCALLLRKHARGVTLTTNGHHVLAESRALLRQAHDLEVNSRSLQNEISGELAVGCFVTLSPFYVPTVLRELRQHHPGLNVRVREGNGTDLTELLRSGAIETGLCYGLDLAPDLQFQPLAEHRPYALIGNDHPLATRESVTLHELSTGPMVLLDLPQPREFIARMLSRAGVSPPSVVTTTSFETMRGLVAAGEGFTLLNQRVATSRTYDGPHVRALDLDDDVDTVRVGTISMRGTRLSRRAEAFIQACGARARYAHADLWD